MVLVQFEVQGEPEAVETGTVIHVDCHPPLTLASLRDAFPYEGYFHFRQRMKLSDSPDYVWVDLTQTREEIRCPTGSGATNSQLPRCSRRVRIGSLCW